MQICARGFSLHKSEVSWEKSGILRLNFCGPLLKIRADCERIAFHTSNIAGEIPWDAKNTKAKSEPRRFKTRKQNQKAKNSGPLNPDTFEKDEWPEDLGGIPDRRLMEREMAKVFGLNENLTPAEEEANELFSITPGTFLT